MIQEYTVPKWHAFIGGTALYCAVSSFTCHRSKFHLDAVSLSVLAFISYIAMRMAFSSLNTTNIFILSVASFCLFYCLSKWQYGRVLYFDCIVVILCSLQSIYGIMQYVGVFSERSIIGVVGSFDNPAGLAACLSAGLPFCFSVINRRIGWLRFTSFLAITLIIIAVFLTRSRAGIVAIMVVSVVYLCNKYIPWLKTKRLHVWRISAICLLLFTSLLFVKQNSVLGRLLIWETSCAMISDQPFVGHGTGSFIGQYMTYQSAYFNCNPSSSYSQLADNVFQPFNEYLFLGIEYGIIGLLLMFVVALMIILFPTPIITPSTLCLLAVGVFACFSYPLCYSFVVVLVAYSLAQIRANNSISLSFSIKSVRVISMLGITGILCFNLIQDVKFEKQWGRLSQKRVFMHEDNVMDQYRQLFVRWNGNPMFLYNYGSVLNILKNYEQSNYILIQGLGCVNNYNVQMIIADNYRNMKQWDEAEIHYKIANSMIPNRFLPLYHLMILYGATGKEAQSIDMAKVLITKEVKIHSQTTQEIIHRAYQILNK